MGNDAEHRKRPRIVHAALSAARTAAIPLALLLGMPSPAAETEPAHAQQPPTETRRSARAEERLEFRIDLQNYDAGPVMISGDDLGRARLRITHDADDYTLRLDSRVAKLGHSLSHTVTITGEYGRPNLRPLFRPRRYMIREHATYLVGSDDILETNITFDYAGRVARARSTHRSGDDVHDVYNTMQRPAAIDDTVKDLVSALMEMRFVPPGRPGTVREVHTLFDGRREDVQVSYIGEESVRVGDASYPSHHYQFRLREGIAHSREYFDMHIFIHTGENRTPLSARLRRQGGSLIRITIADDIAAIITRQNPYAPQQTPSPSL